MTDKEKLHRVLSSLWKNDESVGKTYYNQALQDVQTTIDLQEESVSEDLENASKEWLSPQLDKSYANYGEAKMMELTHFDGYAMLDAIEFGAKWQKAKDEYTTEDLGEYINELSKQFPEVSFAKLSRIAVRVSKWQKEQMIKDATEGEVVKDIANNLYIGKAKVDKNNFKFGNKVKVLVLKED